MKKRLQTNASRLCPVVHTKFHETMVISEFNYLQIQGLFTDLNDGICSDLFSVVYAAVTDLDGITIEDFFKLVVSREVIV